MTENDKYLAWVEAEDGSDWAITKIDTDNGVVLSVEDSGYFDGPTLRSRASTVAFLRDVANAMNEVWP